MNKKLIAFLCTLIITGCSDGIGDSPSPPGRNVELVGVPGPGGAVASNGASPTSGGNSTDFPEVSIMSTGGRYLRFGPDLFVTGSGDMLHLIQ